MRGWVAAMPVWMNKWLAELPTVQFQALVSAVLAMGTAVVYWGCLVRHVAIDSVNFGIWLSFVAAYGGVTYYKSFKTKRETFRPEVTSAQNVKVGRSPIPAPPDDAPAGGLG